MTQTYMTRKDTDVGVGEFDSIAWLHETVLQTPDTGEYHYALVTGHHENSPSKVEMWRTEPNYDTPADYVWTEQ